MLFRLKNIAGQILLVLVILAVIISTRTAYGQYKGSEDNRPDGSSTTALIQTKSDYPFNNVRTIPKAAVNETLRDMISRVFGDGNIETVPGDDVLNMKAKSFDWVFITYKEGSHWDLGVYEFDTHFWLYVKEYFNSEGELVKYDDAEPINNDERSGLKDGDTSPANVLGRYTTCAGVTSYDNPYNCCTSSNNSSLANCVFAAWEFVRQSWGYKPFNKSWGSPGTWATNARSAGFTVSSKPCLYCFAVNSGHVAMPVSFDGSGRIVVNEQNCGEGYTRYNRVYSSNPFTNYIWKKNGQTISMSGAQSPLYASSNSQMVWFRITQNYYYNSSVKFLITFPNGGRTVINSGYYYYLDKVYLPMVLGSRGTWKIQAFYPNGDFSNESSYYVN
jgi:surface antigen